MTVRRIFLPFILASIVLAIQLPAIQRPFLGHFASYQLVMASMARNMARENFKDIFQPKVDLLINGKRALHLNQYPFPSLIAALGQKIFGGSFEFWGRFVSIGMNAGSAVLMALIAGWLWGERTAKIAAALFALSPLTLIYGQGFFSEPFSLFFFLLSLFLLLKPGLDSLPSILGAGIFFSIAVTGRIHWLVFFPVPALFILQSTASGKLFKVCVFSAFALLLPLLWYGYTFLVSIQSDHVLTNLFLQAGARGVGDKHYLLNPAYYRRVFSILSGTMLTPVVFLFLILGSIRLKMEKRKWFLLSGFAAGGLLLVICPQKIMAHDFYLYALFPFLCLIAAFGIDAALNSFPQWGKPPVIGLFFLVYFAASARFFLHPIFKYHEDWQAILGTANAVQQYTQANDTVIVVSEAPAPLVYYADRPALTLDLLSIGGTAAYYMKNPRFSRIDQNEIRLLETAMKTPQTWLEYLKSKKARYLAAEKKQDLEKYGLLEGLRQKAKLLTPEGESFALFQFQP